MCVYSTHTTLNKLKNSWVCHLHITYHACIAVVARDHVGLIISAWTKRATFIC